MSDEFLSAKRTAEGKARRQRVQGPKSDKLHRFTERLDPILAEWGESFIFGEVWARPGLSQHERQLVTIVSLAASENLLPLRGYLHGALQAGVPASKIHEALIHLVVYIGWPATISALLIWQEVVQSARRHGVAIDVEYPSQSLVGEDSD